MLELLAPTKELWKPDRAGQEEIPSSFAELKSTAAQQERNSGALFRQPNFAAGKASQRSRSPNPQFHTENSNAPRKSPNMTKKTRIIEIRKRNLDTYLEVGAARVGSSSTAGQARATGPRLRLRRWIGMAGLGHGLENGERRGRRLPAFPLSLLYSLSACLLGS
ncbi:hypothetical protein SEVIR_4G280901v4 [Setaria viridis]